MPYRINFENVSTAAAPAHTITITDTLDASLDLRTLRLGEIAFGDQVIAVPANRSYYQGRIDLGAEHGNILADVSAGLDVQSGQVRWVLNAIDPRTGESPENPQLGLLPPNDANHAGEGHVTYTIQPKAGLPTGTSVVNTATIVFDNNEPMDTNTVSYTLDADVPSSAIDPLPAQTHNLNLPVSWSGQDPAGGSGLADFSIYCSTDGGPYTALATGTTDTAAIFQAQPGHTYRLYSIARDNAGNVESPPATPDAVTTLPPIRRADLNCDGHVNFDDINPFVKALVSRAGYEATYPACYWLNGDIDGNGAVDFSDINPFVACLVAGACP